ncbi:MAG: S41 family peptidase [Planctomycetes bacterium]|nr:S41 family peptidase [Planctomycetota bacterium]
MQQQPRLPLWFLVANWAMVAAAFAAGVLLGGRQRGDLPEPQATALQLVHAEILRSHVDPHDGSELMDTAIAAMVRSLDPYSTYVPPREVRAYDERNTGQYEDVGMVMTQIGGRIVVHWPMPGGPAARAGIEPGDVLLAVDGRRLADEPEAGRQEAGLRLVRGPAGSEVELLLERRGAPLQRSVRRSEVQRDAVKWVHFADPDAGLGYLHLADFHRGSAAQVAESLRRLAAERPLRGLLLDLRFDGGGSLDECVALARFFLRSGTIVSQRRRGSEVVEVFEAGPETCQFPDLPLVLLVNEHSASASEVLAAALQDHGRAAIVGARTFGKGYVNTVYSWKNLDFRLKLTTAHYFTPNGRNLDGHHRNGQSDGDAARAGGITPDLVVELDETARRGVLRVLTQLEPPGAYLAAIRAAATEHGFAVPTPPTAADDPQLARALTVLRERAADRTPDDR